jgi:hypothetical protein
MKTKTSNIKILVFLIVFCSAFQFSAIGQRSSHTSLKRISTPKYLPELNDSNTIPIAMKFTENVPLTKLGKIQIRKIKSISLVYTRYKLSETFNQLELNQMRVDYLCKAIPGLKENKSIQWIWIEQTGCEDPVSCNDFFHGLVIHLKTEAEIRMAEFDITSLDYFTMMYEKKLYDTRVLDSLMSLPGSSFVKVCNERLIKVKNTNKIASPRTWNSEVQGKILKLFKSELVNNSSISLRLKVNNKGDVVSVSGHESLKNAYKLEKLILSDLKFIRSRYNGKFVSSNVIVTFTRPNGKVKTDFICSPILSNGIEFNLDSFNVSTRVVVSCSYMDTAKKIYYSDFESPVVIKVLDRNKHWKNCLVVTDVTGSMSPYLGQFLYWHKLNLNAKNSNQKFIFFNDGDNVPDKLKQTGKVGGIYSLKTDQYDQLKETLYEAQRNGSGGDGPENNIEAAIKGIREFPECEGIIMIADNWATPRDLELIKQIKVPIHIILCGTRCGVNPAYLNLIYKNGGSIHTIESDLTRLTKMKENQELVIGAQKLILKKEGFESKTTLEELGCGYGGGGQ